MHRRRGQGTSRPSQRDAALCAATQPKARTPARVLGCPKYRPAVRTDTRDAGHKRIAASGMTGPRTPSFFKRPRLHHWHLLTCCNSLIHCLACISQSSCIPEPNYPTSQYSCSCTSSSYHYASVDLSRAALRGEPSTGRPAGTHGL